MIYYRSIINLIKVLGRHREKGEMKFNIGHDHDK